MLDNELALNQRAEALRQMGRDAQEYVAVARAPIIGDTAVDRALASMRGSAELGGAAGVEEAGLAFGAADAQEAPFAMAPASVEAGMPGMAQLLTPAGEYVPRPPSTWAAAAAVAAAADTDIAAAAATAAQPLARARVRDFERKRWAAAENPQRPSAASGMESRGATQRTGPAREYADRSAYAERREPALLGFAATREAAPHASAERREAVPAVGVAAVAAVAHSSIGVLVDRVPEWSPRVKRLEERALRAGYNLVPLSHRRRPQGATGASARVELGGRGAGDVAGGTGGVGVVMQARGARESRFKARSLQQTLAVAEPRAADAPSPSLQQDAAEAASVLPDESRVASGASLPPEAADASAAPAPAYSSIRQHTSEAADASAAPAPADVSIRQHTSEAADAPLAAEAQVEKNFLKKSLQIVASVLPDAAASTAAAGSESDTGKGPVVLGKVVGGGAEHAKKAAHPSDTDASVPVGLQGASLLDQLGT